MAEANADVEAMSVEELALINEMTHIILAWEDSTATANELAITLYRLINANPPASAPS